MNSKTDGGLIKRARFIAIIILFSTIILSVAVPAASAAYNISGYVTNKTSGQPLSGATVQTNTSLTTTTNASGFYNFTVLSNGTYMINASLAGYATNSTNVTVNGADVTNANISLTPVTTGVSSGHSPYGVSTSYGYINAIIARKVILDEPYGSLWNPDAGSGGTNWERGQSVTQYVYGVVISNYGFPIQGANVSVFYTAANGSTNLFPFGGTTDSYGEFNISTSLDNQVRIGQASNTQGPNEGTWNVTINVTYNSTTTSVKRDFILGEYGCGRSATGSSGGCHQPGNPSGVTGKGSAMADYAIFSHDPYIGGVSADGVSQSTHIVYQPSGTQHNAPNGIIPGTNCVTCHRGYNQTGYIATNAYLNNATPLSTNDLHQANNVHCNDCHRNTTIGGNLQFKYEVPQCYDTNCHNNTVNIQKKWVQSQNHSYSWDQHAHDTDQTIACVFCHGPYHNITKPNTVANDAVANGVTESEYCLNNCHKNQRYHNGTLQCTVCHSQAAHEIRFFNSTGDYTYNKTQNLSGWNVGRAYAGKCSTCHQKPNFAKLLNHTNDPNNDYDAANGSYLKGASASKLVADPLRHSVASNNGSKWGNYWNASNDSAPCIYCHGIVYNNVGYSFTESALGHVWQFMGDNTVNSSISSSTYWCASCHWQGYTSGTKTYNDVVNSFLSDTDPVPPEITGNATYGANQSTAGYTNHNSFGKDDSSCFACHKGNLTSGVTITDFMHNVSIGVGGGPNCITCHNLVTGLSGGAPVGINFTAANMSVHNGTNSQNATNKGYAPVIGACWACHDSDGNVTSGHPDKYKTPKTCTDCHLASGTYYNQSTGWSGPTVSEHYYSGYQITAGDSSSNISSCINCHENVSEMIIYNNDTNYGSFTGDGVRLTGGNMSFYHYGRDRSDIRIGATANCSYCHQNTNTAFNIAMSDPAYSKNVSNHSMSYSSSNPGCKACHNKGWIHNSTLEKPVSNDTLCSTCHGTGGSASTNNKAGHKTLYCTECHANNTAGTLAGKDIHSIKYLNRDNTFAALNTSAVNCVTCHQTTNVDSSLAGFAPFKITNPLHHSDNANNGSIWDSYWTTPNTACIYCHSDTKHSAAPLGRILQLDANFRKFGSIGTNTSCANCHYKGDSNYSSMNSTYASAGLAIPPEITNGTSWKGNSLNYFNHSFGTYTDSDCKSCHGSLLGGMANMSEFTHNVATGVSGGANCTNCHNPGGSAGAGRLVNISVMNDSGAIHSDLNSRTITTLPAENKKCWACHGNGSEPGSSHPSNYKTPYRCVDCHVTRHGLGISCAICHNTHGDLIAIPYVTQHYWNGTGIRTEAVTTCYDCHNRTEMMLGTNPDPDGAAGVYGGENGGSNSTSHYGRKRTDYPAQGTNDYCNKCHNNQTTVFPFIDNANKTIANHSSGYPSSNPGCADCHATQAGRIHNSTLYKPASPVNNNSLCLGCHGSNGTGGTNYTGAVTGYKEKHNNAVNCTDCHLNDSRSIHPVRYLQQDGSNFSTSRTNAVNCAACHQGGLGNFSTAPKIPASMNHSTNPYNGSLWNGTQQGYWTNSDRQGACDYCHNRSALHNASGLGYISLIRGGNTKNQSLSGGYWCANCHYGNAPDYSGNQYSPQPPEILNKSGIVPKTAHDGITGFYNHSNTLSLTYDDARCKNCHGSALTAGATSLNFSHNVKPSESGPNCISCHDIAGNGAPDDRKINISAVKLGVHANLNSNASNTSILDPINKACWACHGNGSQPTVHPAEYANPKPCEYCHVNNNYNATPVYKHYPGSVFTGTYVYDNTNSARSCVSCHNNSQVANQNIAYGNYDTIKLKNASISHYAVSRSFGESMPEAVTGILPNTRNTTGTNYGCNKCHSGGTTGNAYGNATTVSAGHNTMGSTSFSCQSSCHNSNPNVNVTLHDANVGVYTGSGCYSSGCHTLGPGKRPR